MSSPQVSNVASAQNAASTATQNTANQTAAQASILSGTISSLGDLKQQAPEVYKAMMQGIAMNICNQMQQQEADREKLEEEFRRENES